MSFFALIAAILMEALLPASGFDRGQKQAQTFFSELEVDFKRLGAASWASFQWLVPVLLSVVLAVVLHTLLAHVSRLLSGLFSIVILLHVLRFKGLTEVFTNLQLFLNQGDFFRAREHFLNWSPVHTATDHHLSNSTELMIEAVGCGAERALREYFVPIFWFLVCPGPAALVLYIVVLFSAARERAFHAQHDLKGDFPAMSDMWQTSRLRAAFTPRFVLYAMEWIPARLLGLSIGLMAQFDDALYVWRQAALHTRFSNRAPLVAVCLSAIGLGADSSASSNQSGLGPMMRFRRLLFRCVLVWLLIALALGIFGLLP